MYPDTKRCEACAERQRAEVAKAVAGLLLIGLVIVAFKTNPDPEDYVPHARAVMDEALLGPLVSWTIDADDVAAARGNFGLCGLLRVENALFVGAFGKVWRLR